MSIKAILFDKDGTLIDFNETWLNIAHAVAISAADGNESQAQALMKSGGFDAETGRFRPDSVFAAGTNAEIVTLWYPELIGGARQEKISYFNEITAREGAENSVAIDGVLDALAILYDRGISLGIATNDSTTGAELTLSALGVAQLFTAAYGYDAVANPKPAPDAAHAFADLIGCKLSEIAMVGDNRHDLEMARAAGVGLAIGVLSGTGTRASLEPLADVILDSVAQLPDFLRNPEKVMATS